MKLEDFNSVKNAVVKTIKSIGLNAINTAQTAFPNFGFSELPEYQEAIDALEKYAEAVGEHADKLYNEGDNQNA